MQTSIPAHLISTYQLLQCAFPNNIEEQEYLPLLKILYDHMSDRCLAQVMSDYTGKEDYSVLNDVYHVGGIEIFPVEFIDSVKQKLINGGYERWVLLE